MANGPVNALASAAPDREHAQAAGPILMQNRQETGYYAAQLQLLRDVVNSHNMNMVDQATLGQGRSLILENRPGFNGSTAFADGHSRLPGQDESRNGGRGELRGYMQEARSRLDTLEVDTLNERARLANSALINPSESLRHPSVWHLLRGKMEPDTKMIPRNTFEFYEMRRPRTAHLAKMLDYLIKFYDIRVPSDNEDLEALEAAGGLDLTNRCVDALETIYGLNPQNLADFRARAAATALQAPQPPLKRPWESPPGQDPPRTLPQAPGSHFGILPSPAIPLPTPPPATVAVHGLVPHAHGLPGPSASCHGSLGPSVSFHGLPGPSAPFHDLPEPSAPFHGPLLLLGHQPPPGPATAPVSQQPVNLHAAVPLPHFGLMSAASMPASLVAVDPVPVAQLVDASIVERLRNDVDALFQRVNTHETNFLVHQAQEMLAAVPSEEDEGEHEHRQQLLQQEDPAVVAAEEEEAEEEEEEDDEEEEQETPPPPYSADTTAHPAMNCWEPPTYVSPQPRSYRNTAAHLNTTQWESPTSSLPLPESRAYPASTTHQNMGQWELPASPFTSPEPAEYPDTPAKLGTDYWGPPPMADGTYMSPHQPPQE